MINMRTADPLCPHVVFGAANIKSCGRGKKVGAANAYTCFHCQTPATAVAGREDSKGEMEKEICTRNIDGHRGSDMYLSFKAELLA